MSFFQELKRRNVVRVGIAYVLLGWVVLQGADFLLDLTGAPEWIIRVFAVAGLVGLPFALFFSWAFEVTPEGIKRESEIDRSASLTPQTGRKLDRVIILFLVLAVGALLAERLFNPSETGQALPGNAVVQHEKAADPVVNDTTVSNQSIAVLPFIAMSNGPDDGYFADGLTEEILNALAQLPELLVTARTSAFFFKGQDVPIQEIAAKLGVAHIVEGSVRRSGDRLRVTAQLIRASDGFHLWSNNYDSTSADTIAVQEDIAGNIAVALNVVMDENKRELMRQSGLRDVEAFITYQKARELLEQAHLDMGNGLIIEGLQQANPLFEEVLQRVPEFSSAWSYHADLYVHQLIEAVDGEWPGRVAGEEITAVFDRARTDYEKAILHAASAGEQASLEFDLAFVTGNWRGMTDRIERVLEQDHCLSSAWFDALTMPFGYAPRVHPLAERLVACDPLLGTSWGVLIRTRIWQDDPDGLIEDSRRALAVYDHDLVVMQLVKGLLLNGQGEEAQDVLDTRIKSIRNVRSLLTQFAAMRGDRERAEVLFAQYRESEQAQNHVLLAMHAWMGNHEAANRIAATLDQHPFGHIVLSIALLNCECGAPWDLSATPEFATKLAESGLSWPPLSPIDYPFKDW